MQVCTHAHTCRCRQQYASQETVIPRTRVRAHAHTCDAEDYDAQALRYVATKFTLIGTHRKAWEAIPAGRTSTTLRIDHFRSVSTHLRMHATHIHANVRKRKNMSPQHARARTQAHAEIRIQERRCKKSAHPTTRPKRCSPQHTSHVHF